MAIQMKYEYTMFVYVSNPTKQNSGIIIQKDFETFERALNEIKKISKSGLMTKADILITDISNPEITYKASVEVSDF